MESIALPSSPWTKLGLAGESGRHMPGRPQTRITCTSATPSLRVTYKRHFVAQSRRSFRRLATADAAESKTASEEVSEAIEEEETSPEEASAEESQASPTGILEAFREALASGEETALAAVEAQLKALEADRDGLADTVQSLEQDIKGAKDRFLRLNADFDNFRKRTEREKLQIATNVKGDVVEALLPMVDSFERAKTSLKLETEAEQRIDGAYQGIYKQFVDVMKALGVSSVETVGAEFNPEVHEAIMKEDSTEHPDGVVSMEFRKGFVIGDKLVRPAMVKVSTGPGPTGAVSGEEGLETASEGEISSEE